MKKLLSLVLSGVLLVGAIPMMNILTVSAAGGTTYFADDFENYSENSWAVSSEISDKSGNLKWKTPLGVKAELVSVTGYDGKTTNAMKLTATSTYKSGSTHRFSWQTNAELASGAAYVYEMKAYMPSENAAKRAIFGNVRFYGGLRLSGDSGTIIKESSNVLGNWTKITFVVKSDNTTVVYVDDKLVAYNPLQIDSEGRGFPSYLDVRADSDQYIIIDDVNMYYSPAATTAEAYPANNATEISCTVNPTITFSEKLLDLTVNSAATFELTNTSDGSAVTIEETNLSVDGKTVTIKPETALDYETTYKLEAKNLKDMYDAAITDVSVTFTTMEKPNYVLTQPTFRKENLFTQDPDTMMPTAGTEIEKLENGAISCEFSITNNDDEAKPVLMFAVLYEGTELKQFQFKNTALAAGATETFYGGFTVGNAANSKIQTFVWNSFTNMGAYGPSYTFDSATGLSSSSAQ